MNWTLYKLKQEISKMLHFQEIKSICFPESIIKSVLLELMIKLFLGHSAIDLG